MRGGGLTHDGTCDQLLPNRQTVGRLWPHGEGLWRWNWRPAALLPQSSQFHVVLPHSFSRIPTTHLYRCLPNTTSLIQFVYLQISKRWLVTKLENHHGVLFTFLLLTSLLITNNFSRLTSSTWAIIFPVSGWVVKAKNSRQTRISL